MHKQSKVLEKLRSATLEQIAELKEQTDPSPKVNARLVALADDYHLLKDCQGTALKSYEKIARCLVENYPSFRVQDWLNGVLAQSFAREHADTDPAEPEDIEVLIALATSVHEHSRRRAEHLIECKESEDKLRASTVTDLSGKIEQLRFMRRK